MGKVLFFGYGAYRDRGNIKNVINRNPGEGVGAVLENYVLVYQKLEQIPEPPRELFRKIYGNDFRAYSIKKGFGVISGIIWELDEEDLELFKKWDFDGIWREFIEVKVKSSGSKEVTVLTDKALDQFPITEVADGLTYEEFENQRVQQSQPVQSEYYTQQKIAQIKEWLNSQIKK